jgi:hypothetical protein
MHWQGDNGVMQRVQSNVLPGYSKTQQLLGNGVMQRVHSNVLLG